MKNLLVATAALVAFAVPGAAGAADLPVGPAPAPIYVPAIFSWTGFYIGGNLAGAWAEDNVTDTLNGVNVNVSSHNLIFLGGGQAGFNYQFSNIVVGVEGDFDQGFRSNNAASTAVIPTVGTIQVASSPSWVSTFAARVGVASDRWLVYGKAGGGWIGNNTFTITNVATGASVSGSRGTTAGWLVGAGVEWAFAFNWTAKIEYDYLGLTTSSFTVPAGAPFLANDTFTTNGNNRNFQMLKVGVNYKFGWDTPVTARY